MAEVLDFTKMPGEYAILKGSVQSVSLNGRTAETGNPSVGSEMDILAQLVELTGAVHSVQATLRQQTTDMDDRLARLEAGAEAMQARQWWMVKAVAGAAVSAIAWLALTGGPDYVTLDQLRAELSHYQPLVRTHATPSVAQPFHF